MRWLLIALALFATQAQAVGERVYVLGGRAVSNSVSDTRSDSWGVMLDIPTQSYCSDLRLGFINEGHKYRQIRTPVTVPATSTQGAVTGFVDSTFSDKRDGLVAQCVWSRKLTQNFAVEAAIGPYFSSTTESTGIETYRNVYRWNLLPSLGLRYEFGQKWSASFLWQHVLARQNKNADVFLLGVGYKF